jgi:rubrerythrin
MFISMSTLAFTPIKKPLGACIPQTVDKEHLKFAKSFKECNDEIKYYEKTAHLLFHYYQAVEKGNPMMQSEPVFPEKERTILQMLNNSVTTNEVHSHDVNDEYIETNDVRQDAGSDSSKYAKLNRAELLNRFMSTVHDNYIPTFTPKQVERVCPHCGNTDLTVISAEAIVLCPICYTVEEILIESDKPGFKDNQKSEISYFSYARKNHLQEWISQIQGREHTSIPDSVYDQILTELKKQKFENVANLKGAKLKEVMKKLRLNKYFEHINHILCHLNGTPVVNLSPELENQLRRMFQLIQTPFLEHAPSKRKNFLSYSYVLHKFLQLLGEDEYMSHFPLLKSRQKLHAQDQIWKKICQTLKWEFIPSL